MAIIEQTVQQQIRTTEETIFELNQDLELWRVGMADHRNASTPQSARSLQEFQECYVRDVTRIEFLEKFIAMLRTEYLSA